MYLAKFYCSLFSIENAVRNIYGYFISLLLLQKIHLQTFLNNEYDAMAYRTIDHKIDLMKILGT